MQNDWFDIINELIMVVSFIGLIDTKLFEIKFFKIYSSLIQYNCTSQLQLPLLPLLPFLHTFPLPKIYYLTCLSPQKRIGLPEASTERDSTRCNNTRYKSSCPGWARQPIEGKRSQVQVKESETPLLPLSGFPQNTKPRTITYIQKILRKLRFKIMNCTYTSDLLFGGTCIVSIQCSSLAWAMQTCIRAFINCQDSYVKIKVNNLVNSIN